MNSYPSMAIDPTNGHLAIVWADNEGNGSCGTGGTEYVGPGTSNQVKLVTSADGQAWSAVDTHHRHPGRQGLPVGRRQCRDHLGRLLHPRLLAGPDRPDRLCGIMELDSATGDLVLPVDAVGRTPRSACDWALRDVG